MELILSNFFEGKAGAIIIVLVVRVTVGCASIVAVALCEHTARPGHYLVIQLAASFALGAVCFVCGRSNGGIIAVACP